MRARVVPFVLVFGLLLVMLIAVMRADGKTIDHKVKTEDTRLSRLTHDIAANRQFTWNCQDNLKEKRHKASVSVWSLPQSVGYRGWVKKLWAERYEGCKSRLELRTIPATGDWRVAVSLVQRIYPGTRDWLLSCSSGEGGHGGWVPNHQGSGASGWMQFMRSTYYAYSNQAFRDAELKGFVLDRTFNSWYHPIGQAITAAYMRSIGISRYHWDPSIDRLCL